MAVRTDDVPRETRDLRFVELTVKDEEEILLGALLCTDDATGEVENATDADGKTFAGFAVQSVDNSDDGETILADVTTCFKATSTGLSADDIGKTVYISDNDTVALTSTYGVVAGTIVAVISATECWVKPPARVAWENVQITATEVAAPTAATSTNGVAAAAIPGALTSTDGVAAAATADLPALAAEAEKIGDDVRAVHAAALLAQAENEKIGDDVRALITNVTALRTALVNHGILADPS